MNGYNDLLLAVQRALDVARTYHTVATSKNDSTNSEKGTIPTLKGRIALELDRTAAAFVGNDGISVLRVEMRTVSNPLDSIAVVYDNGQEDVFTLLDSRKGATIHQYHYANGDLTEFTTHDLDDTGAIAGTGRLAATFTADDGVSLTNAEIQDDGSIKFTYSDGKEESWGNISDFASAPIEKVEIVDDFLQFTVDGVTVEAMARDEDGNPVRVRLTGEDGEEGAGFYANSEQNSLRLLRPGDHSFGDQYFIELFDKFSATQPKLYGPLNKNVRVLESGDVLSVDMTDGTLTLSYPNGDPLVIPNLDGVDKPDSPDQDRTLFDGEYIVQATFDDTERKLYIDTNLTLAKWVIDVPTKQLPSGEGSVISKNNPSPRIPAIVNIEIKDEVNSLVIPVSIGRVVGRDGYDGAYTHFSIEDGKLVSRVTTDGVTDEQEFVDLNYYLPTEIALDPVENNKVRMTFDDGSVLYSEVSANGKDGLVPRIDPTSWVIGDSEDEFSLSFSLLDSDITTDFTNFMKLRPNRGFNVTYDDTTSELTFNFGGEDQSFGVVKGVNGDNFDSLEFVDGQIVSVIGGDTLSSGELASLTSIDNIEADNVIRLTYSDGNTFDIPYTRPNDGAAGDVLTKIEKSGTDITFTYGTNDFVVNDVDTDAWPIALNKVGEDYTFEFNHQPDEVFAISGIDGKNMSYLSDVTILPNGRYQITMDGTDPLALFEKQDVKWITAWQVDEDTNELQVRYNTSPEYVTEAIIPGFHNHKTTYNTFTGVGMEKVDGKLQIFTTDRPEGYTLLNGTDELLLDGDTYPLFHTITVDHEASRVSFLDNEGTEIHSSVIADFNGVDAVSITNITHDREVGTDNEIFTFTLSDGQTQTLTVVDLHGKNAYYPIGGNMVIDHNDFKFNMSNSTELSIEVPEFQGFMPRWIDDMWVGGDAELMVAWSDIGDTSIGRVDGYDANYPVTIREDNNEFIVDFSLDGETTIGTMEGFNGIDGVWITALDIDTSRHLVATMNDGSTIDVGLIDGIDARYIVDITETANEFTVTYNDGSTEVVGTIDGFNGINASIIQQFRVNRNGELVAEMNDGNDIIVGPINGANASYIQRFDESEGVFEIELNDGTVVYANVPDFHAKDGDWLVDLYPEYGITKDGITYISYNNSFDIESNVVNDSFTEQYYTGRRYYMGEFNDGRNEILGAMDADGSAKFITRIYEDESRIMIDYIDGETSVMATISDFNAKDASTILAINKTPSVFIGNDLATLDVADDFNITSNVTTYGTVSETVFAYDSLHVELNTHDVVLGRIDGTDNHKNLATVELRMDDLVVTYDNGEEEFIGTFTFVGQDGTWLNGNWSTTDQVAQNSYGQDVDVRILTVPYGNSEITNTADVGEIDGRDFEEQIASVVIEDDKVKATSHQGKVVESQVVRRRITDVETINDILFIKTNYGETIEVGYTAGNDHDDGRVVERFEIDRTLNRLMVKYNNADGLVDIGEFNRVEFDFATIAADEGAVMDGELLIRLTDGTRFELGRIKGTANTVDVIDALINIDRELILTRSGGLSTLRVANITGVDGTGIKGGFIQDGNLYFTLDDDSEINAGFVQRDLGFAPFNFIRSYNRGESATRNGRIYVALNNELTEEPSEDSSAWAIVRFEDDPSPDAGRPDVISPVELEEHYDVRPFLTGGGMRKYYSVDSREERIFAIDTIDGNFANPVYEASENNDSHQVEMDLVVGQKYKWRIRDRVDTGYITDWSLEGTFTVRSNTIGLPVVTALAGEDRNSMNINAPFTSSAFSDTAGGTHVQSHWEVKRDSDDEILVSEIVDSNLTSFMTPFAILEENDNYSVRVKYITDQGESAFSDWYTFKTKAYFDFTFKPEIEHVGDDINATVARPLFRSTSALPRFYYDYMEEDNVEVFWEVYNSLDELVWSDSNRTFVTEVRVGEQLTAGDLHKIRVRYDSTRLRGYSEWSDFVTFTPQWSIAKPVISNSGENPLEVFFDTTFYVGTRTAATVSVDMSGLTLTGGFLFATTDAAMDVNVSGRVTTLMSDFADLNEFLVRLNAIQGTVATYESDILTITLKTKDIESTVDIPTFVVMVDVTSDVDDGAGGTTTVTTSETFDLVADGRVSVTSPSVADVWNGTNDVYVSHDWEIRRQSDDRLIDGKFADFEREVDWDVMFEEEDSLGEYYAQVRVNGLYGSSEWSDRFNFKLQEIVFTNIYYGTSTGHVGRLDATGSEVWTVRPTTSNITDVTVNDSRDLFVASSDSNLYKLNDLGETTWSYTDHTSTINNVAFYDEGMVATASSDRTVHLIDSSTGSNIWTATDHTNTVMCVAIDLHGDVISGSSDNTVKKFAHSDGSLIWSFNRHTATITQLAVDSAGFVYSYSSGNLRRINPRGFEEWSISIANITAITVDVDDVVYLTNTSGHVFKLNPEDGTVDNSTTTLVGAAAVSIDVDDNMDVFVASAANIISSDENFNEIWSYANPNGNLRTISLNRQPIIVKPTGLTGRFYELKAPTNLVAF